MKNLVKLSFALFAILTLTFSGCKKDDPEPVTPNNPLKDLVLIGETYAVGAGAIVTLYAEADPFVGFNTIYAHLKDSASGNTITDAHITFMPMMDMGMMMHSCPVEQPIYDLVDNSTETFNGAVVFIMPSTAGSWTIQVHVNNHSNGQMGMATIPVSVVAPDEAKLFSFVSEYDSSKMFVTLIEPTQPSVGLNNFEIGVYKKASMMDFPGVTNLSVEMEPEMPSMGHGSSNNTNPESTENGRYLGEVNFTMTGYWKVNLDFFTATNDTIKIGYSFDITF